MDWLREGVPTGSALFDVSVDAGELSALLDRRQRRFGDLSAPLAVVADMLVAGVSDKFDQQGPGWPPLAPSTLAKRRGSVAQILSDTGRLAASIHGEAGPDFAEASTSVGYAVYHVSSAPRTKIPLRDFFDLGDDVYEDIGAFLLDELSRA